MRDKEPTKEYVIIAPLMLVTHNCGSAGLLAVWGGRLGWTTIFDYAQHYPTQARAQKTLKSAHSCRILPPGQCEIIPADEYYTRRAAQEA